MQMNNDMSSAPPPAADNTQENVTCPQCGCSGPVVPGDDGQLTIQPSTEPDGDEGMNASAPPDNDGDEGMSPGAGGPAAPAGGDQFDAMAAKYAGPQMPANARPNQKKAADLLRNY